jgi:hypothetical protein
MAFQRTVPIQINSAYNSMINLDISALGKNVLPKASVVLQKKGNPGQASYYEALTDISPENASGGATITNVDIPEELYRKQIRDRLDTVPDFTVENDDSYTTKLYVGSIAVVGLYIFYRFLVKNR